MKKYYHTFLSFATSEPLRVLNEKIEMNFFDCRLQSDFTELFFQETH